MIEDKLSHDERLRLECIAQSVAKNSYTAGATADTIIEDANKFESYVKGTA